MFQIIALCWFFSGYNGLICSGVALKECDKGIQNNRIVSFSWLQKILLTEDTCNDIPDIDDVEI